MAPNPHEKIQDISSSLASVFALFDEIAEDLDAAVPATDEIWSLHSQTEELQNRVYGIWSQLQEKRDGENF